jgi:diguanylate cyclase (GGDEF)-like protein/PAS domain S-box-containing protein
MAMLRVLLLEDSALDAELLLHELRRAGYTCESRRVETEAAFRAALDPALDIILADYSLPQFNAPQALRCLQQQGLDIPFIVVTGAFEETAMECVKLGATDYLIKDRLGRLGQAVAHALEQRRLRGEARRADALLRESEQRFRALVQHASDVVAILTAGGRIDYVSPPVEQTLGTRPNELTGANFLDLVHPEDAGSVRRALAALGFVTDGSRTVEFRWRNHDGSWRHVEAVASNLLDQPGVHGVVLNLRDITERRRLEEQLSRQAFVDQLTDLPNRALFMDRLEHALIAARGGAGTRVAVLFLDLDGFKSINDTFGHPFGDEVLQVVAKRLEASVRQGDTVARFGGDEFVILVEGVRDPGEVLSLASRLIDELHRPVDLRGHEVYATASVGVALSLPGNAQPQPAELLRNADIALYQAKAKGRARFRLFDEHTDPRDSEQLRLEGELRHAIERHELRLYYQPILSIPDGRIEAVEALLRWQHPRRGLLLPSEFLPSAEEIGLILRLDDWVLAEACRQAAFWQTAACGATSPVVCVNLSARRFQEPDVVERVKHELASAGLWPGGLELEITEGTLMRDLPATMRNLDQLKELGVRLAIDDFGTGYSSLNYIQQFAVNRLKIDRTFVSELGKDDRALAVSRAIITMAHSLGLETIAEGIETAQQLGVLSTLGCNYGQGYYLARPLPADALSFSTDGRLTARKYHPVAEHSRIPQEPRGL